jgi:hypothetical protein
MKKLTELQYEMLCKIIEDDFTPSNGNTVEALEEGSDGCFTYVNQIIEDARDRGTATSLMNAGLIERHNSGTREDCVWLTEEAVEIMKVRYVHNERFLNN